MQTFLEKIPSEQIRSSDDLSQITAKQTSQEVRMMEGALLPLMPPTDECMLTSPHRD